MNWEESKKMSGDVVQLSKIKESLAAERMALLRTQVRSSQSHRQPKPVTLPDAPWSRKSDD